MSKRRSAPVADRGSQQRRRRAPTPEVDARVLALREDGYSFSAIARMVDLDRATDAHRRLIGAILAHDGARRQQLLEDEDARLDRLERRIRDRDASDPAKLERRLLAASKLREALPR